MQVTIFGSSGGVGRELARQASLRGHAIRAVTRRPIDVPAGVENVVVDDVTSPSAIARAIAGADVVLSALGLRRKHPANPWSRIVSPTNLTSRFASGIIEAAALAGSSPRIIVVSAAGVGDSRPRMSPLLRWLFDHSNVGVAYVDLDRMEGILRASPLDWMAVRPVTLTNRKSPGRLRVVDDFGLTAQISRADVARFMLDQAARSAFESRTPMIAS